MKRVPDTLTAECSEMYKVSIRLRSDGLVFSGYMSAAGDSFWDNSLLAKTYLFNKRTDVVDSLKNIIFDNPFFTYTYSSLQVVCFDGKYTLTPDNIFLEQEKDRLYCFCHPKDEQTKILTQPLESLQSVLLFGIEQTIYEFLVRSLVNPQFVHPLAEKLVDWQKNSRTNHSRQLYVVINERKMDVVCFDRGEMTFLNSFDYETDNEIIYYTTLVCKQIDFNQLDDCLLLYGDKVRCLSVMPVIRKYVEQVDYINDTNFGDAKTQRS